MTTKEMNDRIRSNAVLVVECSIPEGKTIRQYQRENMKPKRRLVAKLWRGR